MMIRKSFVLLGLSLFVFMIGACFDESPPTVTINNTDSSLILAVGETYTLTPETSDTVGLTFSSNDPEVAMVDEEGVITALSEGTARITIASKQNPSIRIIVSITVRKLVNLTAAYETLSLNINDSVALDYESNETVTFTSDNIDVVSVNSEGIVTAHEIGQVNITIRSTYDSTVFITIVITVHPQPTSMEILGAEKVNLSTSSNYTIMMIPDTASNAVLWESSDENIATIDASGLLIPLKAGTVTLMATSLSDDRTISSFQVEIVNQIYVNQTAILGDTITYEGITFLFGRDMFNTITEAHETASIGTTILIGSGTYHQTLTLNKEGIILRGLTGANITGTLTIAANQIGLETLSFLEGTSLVNSGLINNFTFIGNTIGNHLIPQSIFLSLDGIDGVIISENTFNNLSSDAIRIRNIIGGTIIISNNIFHQLVTAIDIDAGTNYRIDTEIKIVRNTITHVSTGMTVFLNNSAVSYDILAYARFNSISDYTLFGAKSQSGDDFDFTLNHWGGIPNIDYFDHITFNDLRGYYETESSIISETSYNKEHPAKILIVNPLAEIMLGETYTFNFEILPRELVTDRVRWITSNPNLLHIALDGTVTPSRSGSATLTIRSTLNISINASITVTVTTTPGIELTPDILTSGIVVGDQFTLDATPFPLSIALEPVSFSSSNDTIASIDGNGVVTAHAPGVVTFTAVLNSDSSVTNTFTIEVFDELDEANLLDLLTLNQVSYATSHTWTAVGVGFNYNTTRYESVSRYYFGEIPINTSRIIPVFYAIRSGELMTAHPDGITQYNPHNVYWVVIHDTANTNPGSGALAHANYLYNQTILQNVNWVSWHYTIDDVDIYQHIPEIERAFHAGDGSVLPGQSSTYYGGGNRNGVGIEMGINQDSDMYRTWQRTAKLAVDILVRYNLPRSHLAYHINFSGKLCPQSLINAGLKPLFEEFADVEYKIRSEYPNATITMTSHNPDYLDNTGRIIQMPQRSLTVSYTITVTVNGTTESRTFHTYLPGTDR